MNHSAPIRMPPEPDERSMWAATSKRAPTGDVVLDEEMLRLARFEWMARLVIKLQGSKPPALDIQRDPKVFP